MTFEFRSVRLELRFSFFALLSLMLLMADGRIALLCFAASMLHEAGHLVCLCLFSGGLRAVAFGAGGIVMERNEATGTRGGELCVALGGIAVNLLCCGGALLWYKRTAQNEVLIFAGVNAALGALNLIPVQTLDCWHAIRILLCAKGPEEHAQRVLTLVSNVATVCAVAVSVILFIMLSFNFSLAAVCVYLILLNRKRRTTDVSKRD